MSRTYTTTLGLSIGGDEPTWEGEATVSYTVTWGCPAQTYGPPENCYPADPDEIDDIAVTHIDGQPIAAREHGKHEAQTLEGHIENNDALLSQLLQDAADDDLAEREAALERAFDERRESL